jgi:hypothetical protein
LRRSFWLVCWLLWVGFLLKEMRLLECPGVGKMESKQTTKQYFGGNLLYSTPSLGSTIR